MGVLDEGYSRNASYLIRVITKLPNSEQSYKGKVKTHKYINRQNQSTTENCENRNDPDLVQAFLKKWWVESDFKAPNLPLSLRSKYPDCHYNSINTITVLNKISTYLFYTYSCILSRYTKTLIYFSEKYRLVFIFKVLPNKIYR